MISHCKGIDGDTNYELILGAASNSEKFTFSIKSLCFCFYKVIGEISKEWNGM
jgi:hypothetical protein